MYDNIIFDLYGTLIDIQTDEEGIETWKRMCEFYAGHGIKYNPAGLRSRYRHETERAVQAMSRRRCTYPEIDIVDVFERLGTKKGAGVRADREFAAAAAREFRRVSTSYIRLYEGVGDMLEALALAGKKLYVLSNAQSVFTSPEIEELGISRFFEDISLSSDFGAMKPDASFYQQMMERNHINPQKSVMVGNDYVCDIEAARHVGLATCYIHSGLSPQSDVPGEIRADAVFAEPDMNSLRKWLLADSRDL